MFGPSLGGDPATVNVVSRLRLIRQVMGGNGILPMTLK
jgi:hypothetical protein